MNHLHPLAAHRTPGIASEQPPVPVVDLLQLEDPRLLHSLVAHQYAVTPTTPIEHAVTAMRQIKINFAAVVEGVPWLADCFLLHSNVSPR